MVSTLYIPSVAVAPWYQPPEFAKPVVSIGWQVMATAIIQRPTADNNWHVTCSITGSVDDGVSGEIRFRTSEGVVSEPGRIVAFVGPVLLGWQRIPDWSIDDKIQMFLEGRRTQGTGGGVRVHRTALSLESVPSSGTQVIYPDGYDPGVTGGYPPIYTTEPYT